MVSRCHLDPLSHLVHHPTSDVGSAPHRIGPYAQRHLDTPQPIPADAAPLVLMARAGPVSGEGRRHGQSRRAATQSQGVLREAETDDVDHQRAGTQDASS